MAKEGKTGERGGKTEERKEDRGEKGREEGEYFRGVLRIKTEMYFYTTM